MQRQEDAELSTHLPNPLHRLDPDGFMPPLPPVPPSPAAAASPHGVDLLPAPAGFLCFEQQDEATPLDHTLPSSIDHAPSGLSQAQLKPACLTTKPGLAHG